MVCVYNLVVYYSSNASFRPISDTTAACIVSLLYFCQNEYGYGGAIRTSGGSMIITGSDFVGNTASDSGNNINTAGGNVTCNDDGNTFESSGVPDSNNDSDGNFPVGTCDEF
jgi:hypothetical protein